MRVWEKYGGLGPFIVAPWFRFGTSAEPTRFCTAEPTIASFGTRHEVAVSFEGAIS